MSISFHTSVKALAAVGFSIGDIALLAGAGRSVGTWLRTRYFDQSLLDVMDVEDIIPRSGLVNVIELEERWSKRLVLFQNGRLLPLHEREAREVLKNVKLDRFTWIMTLISAALLASTSQTCLEHVVLDVLSDRCKESDGYEYMVRDLKRNVESWTSTARTRTIARAAGEKWTSLGFEGVHVPGQIPDVDRPELTRLILWLIGAGEGGKYNKSFYTASSDTCAFALVLQHVGIDMLEVGQQSCDESQLSVVFDANRLGHGGSKSRPKRRGMRINLTNMEECISVWPGSADDNDRRRAIFLSAVRGVKNVEIAAAQSRMNLGDNSRGNFRPAMGFVFEPAGKLSNSVSRLAQYFLKAPSRETCEALSGWIRGWNLSSDKESRVVEAAIRVIPDETVEEYLADLQIFTLGHHYGLLKPIVNAEQMTASEAFGSWTWNDLELFQLIMSMEFCLVGSCELSHTAPQPLADNDLSVPIGDVAPYMDNIRIRTDRQITFWDRHSVLQLVAYLFAGAQLKQVRTLGPDYCGVKGHLTIVDSSLLGATDTVSRICEFALLDVDDTVFPSNSLGLLHGGSQNISKFFMSNFMARPLFETVVLDSRTEDFTSSVEPQWDEDVTACMITYRRRGRLVHTLSPRTIFNSVLGSSQNSSWVTLDETTRIRFAVSGMYGPTAVWRVGSGVTSTFHDGSDNTPWPQGSRKSN